METALKDPMDAAEMLQTNVMRWFHFAPDVAFQFLNLPEDSRTIPPPEDLTLWFSTLDLKNARVLFVYGNSFGSVYQAAKKWLEKDKNRLLVIYDDDVFQLREFLKTKLAHELLHHPQVYLFPFLQSDEKIHQQMGYFLTLPYHISVIPAYEASRSETAILFRTKLETYLEYSYRALGEFLSMGTMFFVNYFQNLKLLSNAMWGNKLAGKFQNIPAIICGAGPSLEQSIPYLKELKDKAIIIAGGTSMNALNAKGFQPHFGAGIDPHIDQYFRILANTAYEVPYFYRNRIHPQALKGIHGEKLFVSGAGGYLLPTWVERLLGIESEELEEGHSVVGFSTALATAMGCNPIIFVGMDLAYTENKSYSEGIQNHPIHQRRQFFRTKNEEENLISKEDVYGKQILTTSKWIMESNWFSHFSIRHPNSLLINSTGGGIGFPQILNIPLTDVVATVTTQSIDIEGKIFAAIAEAKFPPTADDNTLYHTVKSIRTEIKNGSAALKEIVKQLEKKKDAKKEIKAFEATPVYTNFLFDFERAHSDLYKRELFRFEIDKKDVKREREILLEHYAFLRKVSENVIKIIDNCFLTEEKFKSSTTVNEPTTNANVIYSQENGRLRVVDKERGLDIDEDLSTTPAGTLHGLSIFKDPNGQVLSQTCYLHGQKEGRTYRYYSDGTLAAMLCYRANVLDGTQRYYYRNGGLRSELNYENGVLHGSQLLYYANGVLKSEFHFEKGLREGIEKRWNENGVLIIEVHYHENHPVETAKEWFDDGKLKKEIFYSRENLHYCKVKQYDHEGVLLSDEEKESDDFFEVFAKKINILTANLKAIQIELKGLILEAAKIQNCDEATLKEINETLASKAKELIRLEELNTKILEAVGLEAHAAEPIWKSPQVRSALEDQYSQVADDLQKGLDAIKQALYELVIKMSQPKQ